MLETSDLVTSHHETSQKDNLDSDTPTSGTPTSFLSTWYGGWLLRKKKKMFYLVKWLCPDTRCIVMMLLPARASEQGNVIGLVSVCVRT